MYFGILTTVCISCMIGKIQEESSSKPAVPNVDSEDPVDH